MSNCFLSLLRDAFCRHAGRAAIEFAHRTYTYGELDERAHAVARLFAARGVESGDRVALFVEDKEALLCGHLGALWCGAVSMPLNSELKREALVQRLRHTGSRAIVVGTTTRDLVASVVGAEFTAVVIDEGEVLTPPENGRIQSYGPGPDDPVLMLYSSGTTGIPKGIVHTQANLASAVRAIVECWRFTPDDRVLNALPLYHIHGLSFASHVSLLAGACLRVESHFHPVRTLERLVGCTILMGVPPFYYAWLRRSEFFDVAQRASALRLVSCGSAAIRGDVVPDLERAFRRPVINRYGMTECHILTSLPLDGPWPAGSVGRPLPGIEVVVRSTGGGNCPTGEVGEVHARGPNLFRNYWDDPAATAAAFRDGWFATGDLGRFDQHGFLELVGRSAELIIVGGFNVYPAVVERVIMECRGVREVAVVGMPDADRGERVAAFVVAADSSLRSRDVQSHCRDRLLDYECPHRVRLVESLPRNPLGKIAKHELRNLASSQ